MLFSKEIQVREKEKDFRRWDLIFKELPEMQRSTVFDLGCSVGDQSEMLARLGANVTGIDNNESIIKYAQSRDLLNVSFRTSSIMDLTQLPKADGIWISFVAAYFNINDLFNEIRSRMNTGGWLAITEIDDLLGHLPLSPYFAKKVEQFYSQSKYDFKCGSKIKKSLINNGFKIEKEMTIYDNELSFKGSATRDVIKSWRLRLNRMEKLQSFLGRDFHLFKKEFLESLSDESHQSKCKVHFYLAKI